MINDTAKTIKTVAINPLQAKPTAITEIPLCHKTDMPDSHCCIFSAVTWHLSGAGGDMAHQVSLFV